MQLVGWKFSWNNVQSSAIKTKRFPLFWFLKSFVLLKTDQIHCTYIFYIWWKLAGKIWLIWIKMNLQWLSEIGFCGNRSFQCSFITSTKLLTVHWDIISSKAKLGMFYSMYTLLKMQTTNIVSIRKLWFHIICIPNNIVWLWYLVLHLLCLCSHLYIIYCVS